MKRPLLLAGHNDLSQSTFSATVLAGVDETAFKIRRLSDVRQQQGFDPVQEMAQIAAAERVIVLFPLHWYGPPSTLVQWTEDALQSSEGSDCYAALAAKPVQLVVSTGGSEEEYRGGMKNERRVADYLAGIAMTFRYFGANVAPPKVYHACWRFDEAEMHEIGRSLTQELVVS